jgi:histidine phosphotransferase ChpT
VSASDLSALVSARLCHDLISPMGAIGNGIELMQLSQTAHSAELDLIAGSLGSALAKLCFYRIAFGAADVQARMSFDEVRAITDAMFQGRFTVAWAGAAGDVSRATVRLVYLALLCLEKSLPMGGSAQVTIDEGAIALAVDGRRTAPPAALWALARSGAAGVELRPDGVQFALLDRALAETGYRLETDFAETRARIRMTAPALAPA